MYRIAGRNHQTPSFLETNRSRLIGLLRHILDEVGELLRVEKQGRRCDAVNQRR